MSEHKGQKMEHKKQVAAEPPYGPNCVIEMTRGYANAIMTYQITAKDKSGNKVKGGGANFTLGFSKHPQGSTPMQTALVDHKNGIYTGTWVGFVPGAYNIDVNLVNKDSKSNAVPIGNSPVMVNLRGPSSKNSTCSGVGILGNVQVGRPVQFTVQARDESGNIPSGNERFSATVRDPQLSPVTLSFEDNQNGTYTATYIPLIPLAPYRVSITFGGVDIKGSPYFPRFNLL